MTTSDQQNKKDDAGSTGDVQTTPNGSLVKVQRRRDNSGLKDEDQESADEDSGSELESESEEPENDCKRSATAAPAAAEEDVDDDEAWEKFQSQSKKDSPLNAKSKETHIVHCPHFPVIKHEWWWVYLSDPKKHMLITAPVQVCSLKQREEVQLKLSAPAKPGMYSYTVNLRSDSYLEFDQSQTIKLDVKEAKKVESHPQWDLMDEEDEDKENEDETASDVSTDYDESDDD